MLYTNTLHSQLVYHQVITPQMESEDLCIEFANSLLREVGETHPYPDDMGDLNTLFHDICGGGGGVRTGTYPRSAESGKLPRDVT